MAAPMTDLPVLDDAELTQRLDAALDAAPSGVLALDADGTLWSGDVGVDTFEAALARRVLKPAALPRLRAEARAHGLAEEDDATRQAEVLYTGVSAGKVPEDHGFAMMAWAFAGFTAPELDAFVASVLAENGLDARLHGELKPVLAWARERGVATWIVSASPRAVIAGAVVRLGIPAARVVAMTPVIDDGVVLPELVLPLSYGPGKVTALAEAAGPLPILGAFGDSPFDLPLLASATVRIAVRPKKSLVARADEAPGLATLVPRLRPSAGRRVPGRVGSLYAAPPHRRTCPTCPFESSFAAR
jgi:phosphoserine phosphatase